jgi:hypothetical protein
MSGYNKLVWVALLLFSFGAVLAKDPPKDAQKDAQQLKELRKRPSYRSDCQQATRQTDMAINNVRARLMTGGDVWWDLKDGKYIVPKVDPASGLPEVSSIFAGAVWLGGYDPAGNLKVAAQTYRSQTRNDFWPGPLGEDGKTSRDVCAQWDKFFRVLGEDIRSHVRAYREATNAGTEYTTDMIPREVLGWPSFGNPWFREIHGFELPNTSQGLAGFWDENLDGIYNPIDGDFPIIEIRGCEPTSTEGALKLLPDEMIFWIYNDAGNIHTNSNGFEINMEVQVQAFAYATNDEINDMTFQRYKLINRATDTIEQTFFAMWVDPDLGCYQDDYIGCDTLRSMMYVYNEDEVDGIVGCDCGGVPTYCSNVPILGVDYFRGPRDLDRPLRDSVTGDTIGFEEIGMSSFVYYNNRGIGDNPPATGDPTRAIEFYRYLSGFWLDGTPFTYGDNGYNVGSTDNVKYAFPSAPDDKAGDAWSMCTAGLSFGDRRTVQASGPFRLKPGAVNELIIGVVWLPSQRYPCPSIVPLQNVDDIAQALFDNCFELTDGPDAPDMAFVELNRELICILTNDESSNNYLEQYRGLDLQAPMNAKDSFYDFEGYRVYQLRSSEVGPSELGDPDKARLVFQADIKNGISSIYNWEPIENPNGNFNLFAPRLMVQGADRGITHSFKLTEDQFAVTDRSLVNHKKYYYMAVAYAHNDYEYDDIVDGTPVTRQGFDPSTGLGQRRAFLEGRKNVRQYVVTPRPILAQYLRSEYGQGMEITRVSGRGNGGIFLEVTDGTRERILSSSFDGVIDYKQGQGPLNVKVINPLEVRNADLEVSLYNTDGSTGVNANTRWRMVDLSSGREIVSDYSLGRPNEQVLQDYGISLTMLLVDTIGSRGDDPTAANNNGAIGASIEYSDRDKPFWFAGLPDLDQSFGTLNGIPFQPLNFIKNGSNEPDEPLDPTRALHRIGTGFFAPMFMMDYRFTPGVMLLSPMVLDNSNGPNLRSRLVKGNLNNVDIVLTPDKSKWSRCVVIETASQHHFDAAAQFGTPNPDTRMFDRRKAPSIGLDGRYATNDGTITGAPLSGGSTDPNDPNYLQPTGMGWFPGYAVDVDCGKRVNIFFGENTFFNSFFDGFLDTASIGISTDMIWNPSSQFFIQQFTNVPAVGLFAGGQHHIYLTNQDYDGCAAIYPRLEPGRNYIFKRPVFDNITWSGIPLLPDGQKLLTYSEGLIPNEVVIKLRANSQYSTACTTPGNPMPKYIVKVRAQAEKVEDEKGIETALDAINVVPNPYYGYSSYETSQFTNTVKITNLPDKCIVTIYSLDGKFIKQYNRNENPMARTGSNPGSRQAQTIPNLEWDLRNFRNIPIASGVYLIHIDAGELGQRVIKWFGVNRQFDPSGL